MTFEWDESTEQREITVTLSDDSDVTASEVRDAVEELFGDDDGGSNGVENTTDSETRQYGRGYAAGDN